MKASNKEFNYELGMKAYLDSAKSRQANIDKFKVKSDPLLQQNDYYVRLINIISINIIQ